MATSMRTPPPPAKPAHTDRTRGAAGQRWRPRSTTLRRSSTRTPAPRRAVSAGRPANASLAAPSASPSIPEVFPYNTSAIRCCDDPLKFTQYLALRYTEMAAAGISPSVGSVGDSYDCGHRILLEPPSGRDLGPEAVADSSGAVERDLRVPGGLSQPPPPPLGARHAAPVEFETSASQRNGSMKIQSAGSVEEWTQPDDCGPDLAGVRVAAAPDRNRVSQRTLATDLVE